MTEHVLKEPSNYFVKHFHKGRLLPTEARISWVLLPSNVPSYKNTEACISPIMQLDRLFDRA